MRSARIVIPDLEPRRHAAPKWKRNGHRMVRAAREGREPHVCFVTRGEGSVNEVGDVPWVSRVLRQCVDTGGGGSHGDFPCHAATMRVEDLTEETREGSDNRD